MRPVQRLVFKVDVENLWLVILSLLKSGPMNGRELRAQVRRKFGVLTGIVTAYKVLYFLESGGYVRSARDGRQVVYTITPKGRRELSAGKVVLAQRSRRL